MIIHIKFCSIIARFYKKHCKNEKLLKFYAFCAIIYVYVICAAVKIRLHQLIMEGTDVK